jgi:nucleotide-binding universal stress UspA family protein
VFSKLLVALDGSEQSQKALEIAAVLAEKYGAEMVLVHVADRSTLPQLMQQLDEKQTPPRGSPDVVYRWMVTEKILGEAKERALALGAPKVRTHSRDGDPAVEIVGLARSEHADGVVMGTRGLGTFGGLFMGSVARKVASAAPCSVITVK